MTVCTQVPSDNDSTNDCAIKLIFAYRSTVDGGIIAIDSPGDTVFPDSIYPVQAFLKNFGNTYLSCFIITTINGNSDSAWIGNHPPGDSVRIVLKMWRVPPNDSTLHSIKICTDALYDIDTTNDCSQKSVYAINPVGIEEGTNYKLPVTSYQLFQNHPNPFSKLTAISYQIPITNPASRISPASPALPVGRPSGGHHVSLKVYDLTGRLIQILVDESQEPGEYQYPISRDQFPRSGVYFYRLNVSPSRANRAGLSPSYTQTRKMILLH
jgi:hypothetical protein